MFCVIYRSSKRDQTYLYVEKKDDFSRVPEELMKGFGQPQLAMILPLDGRKKLVNADIEKVKQALTEQGYYLQLPPPPEDFAEATSFRHGAEKQTTRTNNRYPAVALSLSARVFISTIR
ncbi:putative cytoplasmic protein YcgL [Escherichia coli]|uniref:Protein YcgL n=5 Tax=Gammaproteobacteria TaxID=1236 RepID=A0A376L764_ECOLX|nr:putative cytoplasmic protein YcgL [Escherichia coli]